MDANMEPKTLNSIVTAGIRVSVRTLFVPDQSSVKTQTFVFAYRISIKNESTSTVQLIRRHWNIKDAFGEQRIVAGDGVVGQQPVLAPGEEHSYISGCVFKTSVGLMEGFYTFVNAGSGQEFEARIPAFTLITPFSLN